MKKRILIIDDETLCVEPILDMIEWEFPACECVHTQDGNEGVLKVQTNSFDLIILDMMLPFKYENEFAKNNSQNISLLNGLHILSIIRGGNSNSNTPVICYTMLKEVEVVKQIVALNAAHVCKVAKGSTNLLLEVISKIIK